ncbi:MAG: GyrI-like domain-containing protein [Oscillospiraceae bacterium]
MKLEKCIKQSFIVIGKEGSTKDGEGFIKKLWEDANLKFNEITHLSKKDNNGNVLGIWGVMSDFSRSFNVWENNFSQGLYLAGVECKDASQPPNGWKKWIIPAYEYIYVENEGPSTFNQFIEYLQKNNISLAGAAHDFNCPKTGKEYIYFPIRKL